MTGNAQKGLAMQKKRLKIKICGMVDPQNICEIAGVQPDFMGFIFYPGSPRFFRSEKLHLADTGIQKVGVFVNESDDSICHTVHQFGLHYAQLHGQESPDLCMRLKKSGIRIIKAFSLHPHFSWETVTSYQEVCEYFLFDTPGKLPGGNGHSFDWGVLNKYPGQVPFFLSGGIGIHNVDCALKLENPFLTGIDINSRVELSPGIKQVSAVKKVMMALSHHHNQGER